MKQTEAKLLLETMTPDYDMVQGTYWPFQYNSRMPLFQPAWIPRMLPDQRIQFALRMIKGPILSASRFFVRTDDDTDDPNESPSDLKKFIVRNIDRFWRFSALKALRALDWGYSGSECLYKLTDGKIYFDSLKQLHPRDVKVVIREGAKAGIVVNRVPGRQGRVYLGGPKALWHIHQREENPWYGVSRLFGAFQPWFEMHTDGGAKDIRKLYYRKYAFSGEVMYYPVGDSPTTIDPNATSNRSIAQQLLEKRRTGGVMALPGTTYENGQRKWELLPASPGPGGADILDYHRMMKMEMFEGMGIPSEVAEAAEVGSGWSGRKVPFEAFFAILQEILNWLIFDFDQQILRELVQLNFSEEKDYEIIPFGLLRGPQEAETDDRQSAAGVPAGVRNQREGV